MDGAAWVQAIGSIGAIGAAIWIARDDVRVRRESEKAAERKAVRVVRSLADDFAEQLRHGWRYFDDWKNDTRLVRSDADYYDPTSVFAAASAIENFRLDALPEGACLESAIELRYAAAEAARALKNVVLTAPSGKPWGEMLRGLDAKTTKVETLVTRLRKLPLPVLS